MGWCKGWGAPSLARAAITAEAAALPMPIGSSGPSCMSVGSRPKSISMSSHNWAKSGASLHPPHCNFVADVPVTLPHVCKECAVHTEDRLYNPTRPYTADT